MLPNILVSYTSHCRPKADWFFLRLKKPTICTQTKLALLKVRLTVFSAILKSDKKGMVVGQRGGKHDLVPAFDVRLVKS